MEGKILLSDLLDDFEETMQEKRLNNTELNFANLGLELQYGSLTEALKNIAKKINLPEKELKKEDINKFIITLAKEIDIPIYYYLNDKRIYHPEKTNDCRSFGQGALMIAAKQRVKETNAMFDLEIQNEEEKSHIKNQENQWDQIMEEENEKEQLKKEEKEEEPKKEEIKMHLEEIEKPNLTFRPTDDRTNVTKEELDKMDQLMEETVASFKKTYDTKTGKRMIKKNPTRNKIILTKKHKKILTELLGEKFPTDVRKRLIGIVERNLELMNILGYFSMRLIQFSASPIKFFCEEF
jgi:hypothetical protein